MRVRWWCGAAWGICAHDGQLLHAGDAVATPQHDLGSAQPSEFVGVGGSLSLRIDVDRGTLAVCRCARVFFVVVVVVLACAGQPVQLRGCVVIRITRRVMRIVQRWRGAKLFVGTAWQFSAYRRARDSAWCGVSRPQTASFLVCNCGQHRRLYSA